MEPTIQIIQRVAFEQEMELRRAILLRTQHQVDEFIQNLSQTAKTSASAELNDETYQPYNPWGFRSRRRACQHAC